MLILQIVTKTLLRGTRYMVHAIYRDSIISTGCPRQMGIPIVTISCNPHSLLGSIYLVRVGARKQAVPCNSYIYFFPQPLSVLSLKLACSLSPFPPIICICIYLNLFLNFFIPSFKMLGIFYLHISTNSIYYSISPGIISR